MEDIELWLYEVEGHLASDDYGKDLTSVQNLQKKQALLEADVAAHQVPGFSPAGVALTSWSHTAVALPPWVGGSYH